MPVFWSTDTKLHRPDGGVWVGVRIDDDEVAERVDRVLEAVSSAGAALHEAPVVAVDALTEVHTPELVDFLGHAWAMWEASGYENDPGMNRVVAYAWGHRDMTPAPRTARSPSALAGLFATDTMTLLGPGSWEAIVAAASTALAAADHVGEGGASAYALARPPGHHAGRSFYGGSCYLNNAALAAERLTRAFRTVAVVDVDAHHGNGTQSVFWDRPDVRYGSVHVDPAAGWYPHYVGHAHESGGAPGANRNHPLPPGTGDDRWLEAVADLAAFSADSEALVVSLGVDAAAGDPESPLEITIDGYREAGRVLGTVGLPAVIVQEGGYVLDTLGDLVVAFLTGFEGAQK
ncbi:histone deacetylase family protein [soil metagenome]